MMLTVRLHQSAFPSSARQQFFFRPSRATEAMKKMVYRGGCVLVDVFRLQALHLR